MKKVAKSPLVMDIVNIQGVQRLTFLERSRKHLENIWNEKEHHFPGKHFIYNNSDK